MRTIAARLAVPAPPRRLRFLALVALWLDLRGERTALSRLDDRMLADLGLTPAEARREAGRPFHDIPPRRAL